MENNDDELPGQLTGVRLPGMTARQAIFHEAKLKVEKYKDVLAPHEIVTLISVDMGLGHGKALQYYTDVIRNNGIQYKLDNPEKYVESLKKVKIIAVKKEEIREEISPEINENRLSEKMKSEEVKTKTIVLDGHTKEVPVKKKEEIPKEKLKREDNPQSPDYAGNPEDIKEYEYQNKDEFMLSKEELSPKIEKKPAENQTSILIKPKKQIKTQEQFEKECQEISQEQIAVIKSRDPSYHIPFRTEKEFPVFHENMIRVVHAIWLKRNPGYIITTKSSGDMGTISYPDIS